jgi:anti-sigma factor RsiW
MESDPVNELTDEQLADLARLADGTLPADRRAEVEAAIAASPRLAALSQRQDRALLALRGTADTGASARLRAQVERAHDKGRSRDLRRFRVGGSVIAVAAAAVLALVLVLPGAVSGGPSVATAAALAEKPSTGPAPGMTATPQLLDADVDGVPFPNYAAKFGWHPVGVREDDPKGRDTTTVFYEKDGRRIGYSIVSGDALDVPADARTVKAGGVEFRFFEQDGRNVVTWERGGHTCVLSGDDVSPFELLVLAGWRGKGSIPF